MRTTSSLSFWTIFSICFLLMRSSESCSNISCLFSSIFSRSFFRFASLVALPAISSLNCSFSLALRRTFSIAAARHHGKHEEELSLRLPGQPHDDVVGGHRGCTVAVRLTWELPEILAVVENVGRLHVVGLINLRLDQEEVLG